MNSQVINKTKVLISTLTVISSGHVMANTDVTGIEAKVTVQNTFTFDNLTNLDFGTISAKADTTGADISTLVLPANADEDSIASSGTASYLNIITEGTPATFKVSGVAPNTALEITFPGVTPLEKNTAATQFTISNWTAYITTGASSDTYYTQGSPNLTADDNGNIEFSLGATLSTDARVDALNTGTYADDVYSGVFDLTINY